MRWSQSLFDRQAYVGIAGPFGVLTMGNQLDNLLPAIGATLTNAALSGGFNEYHPGNLDNLAIAPPNAFDPAVFANSIKFESIDINGVKARASYRVPESGPVRASSYSVNYARGPLSTGLAYSRYNKRQYNLAALGITDLLGQTGLSAMTLLKTDAVSTVAAGASYQFKNILLHGALTHVRMESGGNSESYRSAEAGLNYRYTPTTTGIVGVSQTELGTRKWTQLSLSAVHSLSKRTEIYARLTDQIASGDATQAAIWGLGPAGVGHKHQSAFRLGMHHGFFSRI
ncbi:porin [Undibacterium arcticum]